jgi:hypothetical protein
MPYRTASTSDEKAMPPAGRQEANYTEGAPQIPPSGPFPPATGEDLQAEGAMTKNAWRSRNWQGYLVPAQDETTFHRISTSFLHYNMQM